MARYYAPEGGHLRLSFYLENEKKVPGTYKSSALTTRLPTATAESTENLWSLCTVLINVYVASPDPDPYPRRGGQLPNPKSAVLC